MGEAIGIGSSASFGITGDGKLPVWSPGDIPEKSERTRCGIF